MGSTNLLADERSLDSSSVARGNRRVRGRRELSGRGVDTTDIDAVPEAAQEVNHVSWGRNTRELDENETYDPQVKYQDLGGSFSVDSLRRTNQSLIALTIRQ